MPSPEAWLETRTWDTAVLHAPLVQGYDNPADVQHQAARSWFSREIRSAMESSLAGWFLLLTSWRPTTWAPR
jgi:hypothetical protein